MKQHPVVWRNDIGRVGNKLLFRRFKETLGKIRDRRGVNVVCRVLPRRGKKVTNGSSK